MCIGISKKLSEIISRLPADWWLHELKREARAIDDDTSDAISCAGLIRLSDFRPGKRSWAGQRRRFATIVLRYLSRSINTQPQISLSVPFSYFSFLFLDQVHFHLSPLSTRLRPSSSDLSAFLRAYIFPISQEAALMKMFGWRQRIVDELAGLSSLIVLLGDPPMSGLRADKSCMLVFAYVLLLSHTLGLFNRTICCKWFTANKWVSVKACL